MSKIQYVSKYQKIEFNYTFFDSNINDFIYDSTSVVFNNSYGDLDSFIKTRIETYRLIGLDVYSYGVSDVTEVRRKTVILKKGSEQIEI